MTDPDPREDEVSALLRSLGDSEPLPDDVRARLDDALAGLVAEQAEQAEQAAQRETEQADRAEQAGQPGQAGQTQADRQARRRSVVPLRRRRRAATMGLLAAAAFLGVVGLGAAVVGGALDGVLQGGEDVAAGDAESGPEGTEPEFGSDTGRDTGGGAAQDESAPEGGLLEVPDTSTATRDLPDVDSPETLRELVRVIAREDRALAELDSLSAQRDAAKSARCAVPEGPGRTAPVSYRGERATLVVRRDGGDLEASVYTCELGTLVERTRVRSDTLAE